MRPASTRRRSARRRSDPGRRSGAGRRCIPAVFDRLVEAAEAASIPYTISPSARHTGTDADAIHLARGGIPTGVVSIPLRYMHSPVEMVQLDDVANVAKLMAEFAKRLEPGHFVHALSDRRGPRGPCRTLAAHAGDRWSSAAAGRVWLRLRRRFAGDSDWVRDALADQYELGSTLPLRDAPWVGTHNSFNSTGEMGPTLSAQDSNQRITLVEQLDAGRALARARRAPVPERCRAAGRRRSSATRPSCTSGCSAEKPLARTCSTRSRVARDAPGPGAAAVPGGPPRQRGRLRRGRRRRRAEARRRRVRHRRAEARRAGAAAGPRPALTSAAPASR